MSNDSDNDNNNDELVIALLAEIAKESRAQTALLEKIEDLLEKPRYKP